MYKTIWTWCMMFLILIIIWKLDIQVKVLTFTSVKSHSLGISDCVKDGECAYQWYETVLAETWDSSLSIVTICTIDNWKFLKHCLLNFFHISLLSFMLFRYQETFYTCLIIKMMLKHFCKRIYDLLTVFTVSEKNSWELFWHPCQLSYSFRSKIWIYLQLSSVECPPLHSMQASENMFHSTRSGAGHIRPLSMISKIEERLVKSKAYLPASKNMKEGLVWISRVIREDGQCLVRLQLLKSVVLQTFAFKNNSVH